MNENTRDGFENFSETSIDDFLSGYSDSDSSSAKYDKKNIFSDVIFNTSKIFTFSGDKHSSAGPKEKDGGETKKPRLSSIKRRREDTFTPQTEEDELEAKMCKFQSKTLSDIECIKLSVLEIAKTLKSLTEEIKEIKETQLKLLNCLEKNADHHTENPLIKEESTANDLFIE